jgi:hypothetical protein
MRGRTGAFLFTALLSGLPARAQVDPVKRFFLAGGYEQSVAAPGPVSPYALLYYNGPGAAGPGSALRVALAPVFADAELALPGLFGGRTDAGFGFSGGGYAFGHAQVVRGDEKPGESFIGHGGGPSFSLYPLITELGPVPVSGVFRLSAVYTDYQRTARSDARFEPPPDSWNGLARAGVRLGGVEPGLDRGRALEFSLWTEAQARDKRASYGYDGDRAVERGVNLVWGRLHASLPGPRGSRVSGGLNAGAGGRLGRLAAYRLGGLQPQTSEFPLILPGYFSQEISARRYAHAWAQTAVPVGGSKRFKAQFIAAAVSVTPVAGTDPAGPVHAGAAAGLGFEPPDGALRVEFTYGYAPTALRGSRRGGHSAALAVEIDFLREAEKPGPPAKTRQQGLRWLLGR